MVAKSAGLIPTPEILQAGGPSEVATATTSSKNSVSEEDSITRRVLRHLTLAPSTYSQIFATAVFVAAISPPNGKKSYRSVTILNILKQNI